MTAAATLPHPVHPVPISGPAALLEVLRELPLPAERPLTIFAWLDEQRSLVQVSRDLDSAPVPMPRFLVEVRWLAETATAAEVAASRQSLAAVSSRTGEMMLDRLVCHGNRWWSALCQEPACCPPEGRILRGPVRAPRDIVRREAWRALQDLREGAAAAGIPPELAKALSDRAVRDCVLSDLGHRPEQRAGWLRLFQSTPRTGEADTDAAVQTIIAAIAYLADDVSEVAARLAAAEVCAPQYSLAKLLRQAIAISAPTELALSAFCSYTSEQLLEIAAAADEAAETKK